MKIVFICGSLESGKDGVGDYTISLAVELIRTGHDVLVIGLIDPFVQQLIEDRAIIREQSIHRLRIPSTTVWAQRCAHLKESIQAFQPDLISLQFVPWTYGAKGCVYGLGSRLASCWDQNIPLHLMLHELWIGNAPTDPLKQRILGKFQKHALQSLIRYLKPQICQTSNPLYQARSSSMSCDVSLLPLFGNIQISTPDETTQNTPQHQAIVPEPRNKWRLAGVFGTLHPSWDPCLALHSCLSDAKANDLQLGLVLMGRNGHYRDQLKAQFSSIFGDELTLFEYGELPESAISELFSQLDFGIATSPIGLIGKSGSAIAMLEHGLPLLVTRDDVVSPQVLTPDTYIANRATLFQPDDFSWETFLLSKSNPKSTLPEIAQQFICNVSNQQSI